MKIILFISLMMVSVSTLAQDGKATTTKKTFSRTTEITQTIDADASVIWKLLTNASDYSRWNSTIISIEGNIEEGEKIKLKSTLDSSRVFKLKVKEFVANERLVWGDALGKRTYSLSQAHGKMVFSMHEKIGGLMFPLFAKKIPSFDESFEQFAADLKKEAESN